MQQTLKKQSTKQAKTQQSNKAQATKTVAKAKTNTKQMNVSEYLMSVSQEVQKPNPKSAYAKIQKLASAFQKLEAKGQNVCVKQNSTQYSVVVSANKTTATQKPTAQTQNNKTQANKTATKAKNTKPTAKLQTKRTQSNKNNSAKSAK